MTSPEPICDATEMIDCQKLLKDLESTYALYMQHGPRSSKKVDFFHQTIKDELEKILAEKKNYSVKLECNIPACNSSGKKKCDIVVFKNGYPYIIFPVKIIMSNYKQNKNNSWENLSGELQHLKWHSDNDNIIIIPINILMNKTPYLKLNKQNKLIKCFETVTYDDIKIYNILKTKGLCYDIINYIVDVNHIDEIGNMFCTVPDIIGLNKETPFYSLRKRLEKLL